MGAVALELDVDVWDDCSDEMWSGSGNKAEGGGELACAVSGEPC